MSGTDLYRFFDADDKLLYVGISLHAAQRASTHKTDKPWWPDVHRMQVEHLTCDRSKAEAVERQTIIDERPRYNIVHNTREIPEADRLVWICELCDDPIADGQGYVECSASERMQAELAEDDPGSWPRDSSSWQPVNIAELLAAPRTAHWWAIHRECDPAPERTSYFMNVENLRTVNNLLRRTLHLMEKRWVIKTDWPTFISHQLSVHSKGHWW